ncbi:MAG TPA: hypothetical protein VMF13_20025, partial [Luteitalea sp.]|nr:hypothetical protein [Luteitalea sp.]
DSYRAFRAEVEWRERPGAIVLVSPDRDGGYLVDPVRLQSTLVGLAQVVQVVAGANTFEMSEVLGKQCSAWGGSINVLSIPTAAGTIRYQYFLPEQVREWGNPNHRISQVLAWVTAGTNLSRLRKHIRPEGVIQLATVRRMQRTRDRSAHMDVAQLRQELVEVTRQAEENNDFFNELVGENARLEESTDLLKQQLAEARDEIRAKDYQAQTMREQLQRAGSRPAGAKSEELLRLIARKDEPTPADCLALIEQCHGDICIVLDSAKESAQRANGFLYGRDLLDLLLRLVTTYRNALMDGGDSKARNIFGKKEFAAKESETVMANKTMRRQRTFEYEGEQVEMFRHLKIGVADDCTKTIRVHFHWDSSRQQIIIGYCGAHLSVTSH